MDKITCTECKREFDSYKGLQNHNSRTHKINGVQTHINVYYNGKHPLCACGCGQELNFQNGKFGEYIRGHVARTNGGFYTEAGINKSSETRRQQYKEGVRKQWNAGKRMTDKWHEHYRQKNWGSVIRNKKISEKLKEHTAKRLGYESWQHWYDTLPGRKRYYYNVWQLTEQVVHMIPGYDPELRGIAGKEGAYQVDHIISIADGYRRSIPPEEIAELENLQFIPWRDNLMKGS
jgi:hypothetical protein